MTVLCNGGTSGPKPGLGTEVILPTSLIAGGLALISPWLIPVAALIEGELFDLVSSCSTDPPALPVFGLADAAALVGGVFNPNFPALLTKVRQLVQYYFWFQYCQCNAPNPTPAIGPGPLPPPGVYNPGQGGAQACFNGSFNGPVPTDEHPINGSARQDISTFLLPTAGLSQITVDTGGVPIQAWPVPMGVTRLEWTCTNPHNTICAQDLQDWVTLIFYPDTVRQGTFIGASRRGHPGFTVRDSFDIPAGTVAWLAIIGGREFPCGQLVGNLEIAVQSFCNGQTSGSFSACCPPDPALLNLTQQIYQLAVSIASGLPQSAHSYADATVHANLSGNGSFTLHDNAIALRAEVTAGLPVDRVYVGNPTYYFDVGFITPLISGSPYKGSRLVYQKQLLVLPNLVDSIGYQFANGVSVKITELVKGP